MIGTSVQTGIGHLTALSHEPYHYAEGDDIDDCFEGARRKDDRSSVCIAGGTFAWIAGPKGNTVGLWKAQAAA